MIALSHPLLRPETDPKAVRQYSQWFVDVIDLEENAFKTLPVNEILNDTYPELRCIASVDRGDYLQEMVSATTADDNTRFVLTFNYLTRDRNFVRLLRLALRRLEENYQRPVDVEFTVDVIPNYPYPDYRLNLLQCRPLSRIKEGGIVEFPEDAPVEDTLFTTQSLVPDGKVSDIRYVIYIDPELYKRIPDMTAKRELGRVVGRLNKRLEEERFILIGPGRWGSVNLDLGVHVSYGDIYNTKALVEMAFVNEGQKAEFSYGTHFFQDLVESGIYSLALQLGDGSAEFNRSFFLNAPNCLADLLPDDGGLAVYLRVIDLAAVTKNKRMKIVMDGAVDKAIGYLIEAESQQSDL